MSLQRFRYFGRVRYHANMEDSPWGEHESTPIQTRIQLLTSPLVDYILFSRLSETTLASIALNSNEVEEVRLVSLADLRTVPSLTPWLRKIMETGLLEEWLNAFSSNNKPNTLYDSIINLD
jgi:isopentenyldiphosphate isomerase